MYDRVGEERSALQEVLADMFLNGKLSVPFWSFEDLNNNEKSSQPHLPKLVSYVRVQSSQNSWNADP